MYLDPKCLLAHLDHAPEPLKFGTSGRRGPVIHLTQLEIYINALADLEYLLGLSKSQGGIIRGEEFYFAFDLRPSSSLFVPKQQGRGEIAQAIERAIADAGLKPINLGCIPTPALAYYAIQRARGSMMITGSHIPFDLNGYKTNSSRGELTKKDEEPIGRKVQNVRERIYLQPFTESLFNEQGRFKCGHLDLSPEITAGRFSYLQRYSDFFSGASLAGKRLMVYQHSAVGRDLLVEQLRGFGADVIPTGRSETFVPIDTENIDAVQLNRVQTLTDEVWKEYGPVDAVISTDGDSDRPLILGFDPAAEGQKGSPALRFFPGDVVGMVVAERLGADAVVVPISCNDAVDRGHLKDVVEPKTRIGSPFVIAGMEVALSNGRRCVCGWEANGGFLLGSDVQKSGKTLSALLTRDAMLPILEVLFSCAETNLSLYELFHRLPRRFSHAGLLQNFPRHLSSQIIQRLSLSSRSVEDIYFNGDQVDFDDSALGGVVLPANEVVAALDIRRRLSQLFSPAVGFGAICRLNYTDGLRMYFNNGDIVHIRPSGNADELRIYALADTESRVNSIISAAVTEPDGTLRRFGRNGLEGIHS